MSTESGRDVVIVGGGIVGIAAAYYLAEMGARCVVLERDGIASHASGFAYGGLSGGVPNGPHVNTPIIDYSMGLYPALAESLAAETDIDIQYQPRALLRLALDDEEATRLSQHLDWQRAQPGYDVAWLAPGEARALEPRISPDTVGALHVVGGADVEPYRLTLALAQAAEKRGATIRTGEATGVAQSGGRVTGVEVAGGGVIPCGAALLAMGPWTGAAESWLGVRMPVRPLKGQIIRLRAEGAPYELSVGHGSNYAMTKPSDGLVWCGTTEEEAGFDESRTTGARDGIIESTLRMLPALESAELVLQTACLRPVAEDGAVVLGAVDGVEGAYVATGGARHGIMLGPGMARAAAELIAGDTAPLDVGPYSPMRFGRP